MRVLHVIDALGVGGGAEHSLASMLPLLRERGIESTVITLVPRKGGLGERLRSEGYDVRVMGSRTWPTRVAELRKQVRLQSPDLVHATLFNASMASRLALVRSRVPLLNSLVNTTYDPVRLSMADIVPWKMNAMRVVDGFTARHMVDHFHVLTDAVRAEAEDVLGVDPSHVTVIPRGRSRHAMGAASEARRSDTRRLLGVPPDAPVVLNVGRQDNQKSQADLVRAFASVLRSHPDSVLLIAGRPGDASGAIESALDEVGAGESIRLLGHRTDVHDLYVAADLFVFPSRYEGLGCSLLEAMALETPIVGSDAAAIAEVLEEGELGEVVPRGDLTALGASINRLIEDREAGAEFARRAAARFDERYDLDVVAERTAELYRRVVEEYRR